MPRLSHGSENFSNNYSKRQHSRDRYDQDDRSPEKRRIRSDLAQDNSKNNSESETWVDVFMGSLNKKMTGKRLEKILLNEHMRITEIQWLAYKFKKSAGGCQARVVFECHNDAEKCIRRWHKKSFGWNEDYPVCVSQYRANNSVEVRETYLPETSKSNQNPSVYERKSQDNNLDNQSTPMSEGDIIRRAEMRVMQSKTICRTIYTPVSKEVKSVDNSPARDIELPTTSAVVASDAMPSDFSAETRAVATKIKIENQEFNKRIIKQKDAVIKMKDDTIDMNAKIINSKNTVIKKKDAQLADTRLVTEERDKIQSKFEEQQTKFDQQQIEIDQLQKENRDLKLAQLSELKACHEEITEQHETNTNLRAEVKLLSDEVELLKSKPSGSETMKLETENKTLTLHLKALKATRESSKCKKCTAAVIQKEEKGSEKSVVKQESTVDKNKLDNDDTIKTLKNDNNKMAQQVKFLAKTNSDMNSEKILKCMNYTSEITGLEQKVRIKKLEFLS